MFPKSTPSGPVRHSPVDHDTAMGLQWEQLGNMLAVIAILFLQIGPPMPQPQPQPIQVVENDG